MHDPDNEPPHRLSVRNVLIFVGVFVLLLPFGLGLKGLRHWASQDPLGGVIMAVGLLGFMGSIGSMMKKPLVPLVEDIINGGLAGLCLLVAAVGVGMIDIAIIEAWGGILPFIWGGAMCLAVAVRQFID